VGAAVLRPDKTKFGDKRKFGLTQQLAGLAYYSVRSAWEGLISILSPHWGKPARGFSTAVPGSRVQKIRMRISGAGLGAGSRP